MYTILHHKQRWTNSQSERYTTFLGKKGQQSRQLKAFLFKPWKPSSSLWGETDGARGRYFVSKTPRAPGESTEGGLKRSSAFFSTQIYIHNIAQTCELAITWFASSWIGNLTPSSDEKVSIGDRVPEVRMMQRACEPSSEKILKQIKGNHWLNVYTVNSI